jgi:hypothetical protein
MRALDDVLPHFDVNEVHMIALPCTPERAVELMLAARAAPDRLVAMLFRARRLPPDATIHELFGRMRFDILSQRPKEVVVGASGTPWRLRGGIRSSALPGRARCRS